MREEGVHFRCYQCGRGFTTDNPWIYVLPGAPARVKAWFCREACRTAWVAVPANVAIAQLFACPDDPDQFTKTHLRSLESLVDVIKRRLE